MTSIPPANPPTVPSTPDLTSAQTWAFVIQTVLQLLGAFGIAVPAIFQTPSTIAQLAGLASLVAGIVLALISKRSDTAKAHQSVLASIRSNAARRVV